jgi:enamine deaminase RidA (YjgF/YER057c/UK114 family)
MDSPKAALQRLGIVLPPAPAPIASYSPWVLDGALLAISGQVSTGPDGDIVGTAGVDATVEDAVAAARLCGLNLLSQIKAAIGDLDRVRTLLKLNGYVKAAPGFTAIPEVVDGCSSLLLQVFGDSGRHARSAVAVPELPRGCLVEVDLMLTLRD